MAEPDQPAPAPLLDEGSGERSVDARYADPLELIWRELARQLGWTLELSDEVYAHWDGAGALTLAGPAGHDADDCLAQLLLHEVCHALIEGPEGVALPDWGLSNRDERDLPREYACHRLQAALTGPHGLRRLLAPTTAWRAHYDALPADPLACPPDADPAVRAEVEAAREGWQRSRQAPWAGPLQAALTATATLARLVAPAAPSDSLWRRFEAPTP